MKTAFALLAACTAAFTTLPAAAQDAAEPAVNQVIVYGDQKCPEATGEEIVVCVRREDPFRLPGAFRGTDAPANEAWSERVAANANVGDTGAGSCSTVGQGGFTGCTLEQIERAVAEQANSDEARFGDLIAEERARRLSEIDQTAAEEQARVEQIEREYEARLAAERDAETPALDAQGNSELPMPR